MDCLSFNQQREKTIIWAHEEWGVEFQSYLKNTTHRLCWQIYQSNWIVKRISRLHVRVFEILWHLQLCFKGHTLWLCPHPPVIYFTKKHLPTHRPCISGTTLLLFLRFCHSVYSYVLLYHVYKQSQCTVTCLILSAHTGTQTLALVPGLWRILKANWPIRLSIHWHYLWLDMWITYKWLNLQWLECLWKTSSQI